MEKGEIIYGIHPVEEALESNEPLTIILIKKTKEYNERINSLVYLAQAKNIKIKYINEQQMLEYVPEGVHQGIIAFKKQVNKDSKLDFSKNFYLMIDHITDVHNLGAILRSAEFFKVDGVILPQDRNAKINEVVEKTSSGAVNYLNIIWVTNLVNEIKKFKEENFWVIGADVKGEQDIYKFEFPKKSLIILGNEEKGISPLVSKHLDFHVFIPRFGKIDSLNVSVASALFLFQYRSFFHE